jgi:hypothetical protein
MINSQMVELSHVTAKGPHQPFGQLLQRRSDWLEVFLKW